MIFTLNGGPGDGQKVEVGGKHDDGRTVRFTFVSDGEKYFYVCPSDDDFSMRQLFLSHIGFPLSSADLDIRDSMRKKPKMKPIPKEALLAAEKKYQKRDTLSHEQWEHLPVKQKPSSKSNDLRSGRHAGEHDGSERASQNKPRRISGDGQFGPS